MAKKDIKRETPPVNLVHFIRKLVWREVRTKVQLQKKGRKAELDLKGSNLDEGATMSFIYYVLHTTNSTLSMVYKKRGFFWNYTQYGP